MGGTEGVGRGGDRWGKGWEREKVTGGGGGGGGGGGESGGREGERGETELEHKLENFILQGL